MKAKSKLIILLNHYLQHRETATTAKQAQEATRDAILELLPPNTVSEWTIEGWGKVTHKRPKDSLIVDLEALEKKFPVAYAACVSTEPNTPRFNVYPETAALVKALKGVVIEHALSRL